MDNYSSTEEDPASQQSFETQLQAYRYDREIDTGVQVDREIDTGVQVDIEIDTQR